MSSNDSMPYDRNVVRFPSCGAELCGLLFTPKASGKVPAIVMAPGFSGVKEGSLMKFAQFFAASGFAVLAFDNINFGDSGGDIRQEADPVLQKRGYRDAITFIGGHDKVDRERIGIWGSSYSGGHVLEVAATDRRVKCVVSQIPLVNGLDGFMRSGGLAQRRNVLRMLDADREARFRGEAPGMIKAVSDKADELCTMPGLAAYNYFTEQQAVAVNWKNEVTLRSVDMLQSQLNDAFIRFISPTPLLVVTVLHDELVATATDLVLAMYEKALEPKKLVTMPGDHFAPYRAGFPVASQAALEWFRLHLWQQ